MLKNDFPKVQKRKSNSVGVINPYNYNFFYTSLCNRSFWRRFYVVALRFGFFCWCRGFCHRTELDPILFLLC